MHVIIPSPPDLGSLVRSAASASFPHSSPPNRRSIMARRHHQGLGF
uniref:Uncharacterized protein n=1 Tax=Arundo donax TaxID=35708 RepID=A0A0A9BFM6_ARUDO